MLEKWIFSVENPCVGDFLAFFSRKKGFFRGSGQVIDNFVRVGVCIPGRNVSSKKGFGIMKVNVK